jgi:hypothetical protein
LSQRALDDHVMKRGVRAKRASVVAAALDSGNKESTLVMRSVRGVLRVVMNGDAGEGRWHMVGGSPYAAAAGSGTLTQTPERAVLVGPLIVRDR